MIILIIDKQKQNRKVIKEYDIFIHSRSLVNSYDSEKKDTEFTFPRFSVCYIIIIINVIIMIINEIKWLEWCGNIVFLWFLCVFLFIIHIVYLFSFVCFVICFRACLRAWNISCVFRFWKHFWYFKYYDDDHHHHHHHFRLLL